MANKMADNENKKVADAIRHSWVYWLPESIWPFAQLARWERPIGWQLLMWPCWWSAAIVAAAQNSAGEWGGFPNPWHLLLFGLGAVLMRGAGCTYNDLVDVEIDSQVARTRSRPLPSGRATKKGALIFLGLQLLLGLIVLLQFNTTTILLGLLSIVTVIIYPFMKRVTWWPQLFLGFAFSWGALMGWPAVTGSIHPAPVLLYLGCICWVIGYDTIYAHQDKEDDALVGVKSTARLFAENTKMALALLYGIAIVLFAAAAATAGLGLMAFIGLVAGATQMFWQIRVLDIGNPDQCLKLFKSNSLFGWILFVGFSASGLVA